MNSLEIVSSIKSQSRKKYYDENALKAYKDNLKSYKKNKNNQATPAIPATPLSFSIPYDYAVINEFLQVNNVNTDGINLINLKTTKGNKKRAKNIIEIVKGIDKRMVPLPRSFKKPLYKGITHISKRTLDSNTPVIYKSFSSTTADYETALNFTYQKSQKMDEHGMAKYDEYSIVLKLQLDPSIKVFDYEDETYEAEYLLERNTIISNFVFNSYDKNEGVYIYDAIVSKYSPELLFIPKPKKASVKFPDFLGLLKNEDISPNVDDMRKRKRRKRRNSI
jgi:hypothetical protein